MMKMMTMVLTALLAAGVAHAQPREEFEFGTHDHWDINRDSVLDGNEIRTGLDSRRAYDDWDTDGDGLLNPDEFSAARFDERAQRFGEWDVDRDGLVDQDELAAGLLDRWDRDADGVLDEDEFELAQGRFE